MTINGIIFSFMDTSSGETEFDIFYGDIGSTVQDKLFAVGIPYASTGCGRTSNHISFSDQVNMYSVGRMIEYGVRAIQTYTNLDSDSLNVTSNQPTFMSLRQFRVPFLVDLSGYVKTKTQVGVEGVTVSYCHIDKNTGLRDTNPQYCPVATFVTDKLGQYIGTIQVANIDWNSKFESFYVDAFYNQTLSNKNYVLHTFSPTQQLNLQHLVNSITSLTDTTTISIFGSIQFDPNNMGPGSYFCPFDNVPVIMVQGNGQFINTTSDAQGQFTFSVIQSDSVTIYIPDYNGNQWRSEMSVASSDSVQLSSSSKFYTYAISGALPVVYGFNYDAVTSDGGQWIKVLSRTQNIVTINADKDILNGLFHQYSTGNVKYIIIGVVYNYYKRLTHK